MSPQDALVAVMVACSASDENMRTAELVAITRMVNHMPAFATYDPDRIRASPAPCSTCSKRKTASTPSSA
jgi:tellurite resistance protein